MLGVNDKNWLVDMLCALEPFVDHAGANRSDVTRVDADVGLSVGGGKTYSAYFGLGHNIKLHDRPGVFKVSLAGMSLGAYLLRGLEPHELKGRFLDLGTGSGVLALLLRGIGAEYIAATDISLSALALAKENERLNFNEPLIRFYAADLFDGLPVGARYDTLIFNPPGWRTPSPHLLAELDHICDQCDMAPQAMFYGDELLLRFLRELPFHLHPRGRALVGLNSLIGIRDVIQRHKAEYPRGTPLNFRLLERHSLPLLFYSDGWKKAESALRAEFAHWREHHGAVFTTDSHNRLYWSYEVVSCSLTPSMPE